VDCHASRSPIGYRCLRGKGDSMGAKLIRLDDGLLVEVEAEERAPTRIAAKAAVDVGLAVDKVQDILRKAVTVKVARSALRIPLALGESRGEGNVNGGSDLHSPGVALAPWPLARRPRCGAGSIGTAPSRRWR
jgi:hypothetical protein